MKSNIYGTKYLIRADGFPWVATKREIVDFFGYRNILNGENGVHFIIDKVKNSRNEAFIQLVNDKAYQNIMTRKIKNMGNAIINSE